MNTLHKTLTALGMLCVLLIGIWGNYQLFGSERAKQRAIESTQDYINNIYPHFNLMVQDALYVFEPGAYYYVSVSSENSMDTDFGVRVLKNGEVFDDDIYNVASGQVTFQRLYDSYDEMTKQVFDSKDFPYRMNYGRGYIESDEYTWDDIGGVNVEELVLDEEYDIRQLGEEFGRIHYTVSLETFSYSNIETVIKKTKDFFDTENVPFRVLNLTVDTEEEVHSFSDILYEEINDPDFISIIKQKEEHEDF